MLNIHKRKLVNWNQAFVIKINLYLEDNDLNRKIMSEWEHYALLSFIRHKSFKYDFNSIAERFSSTPERMKHVLQNLINAGLIVETDKGLKENGFDDVVFDTTKHTESLSIINKSVLKTCL